MKEIHLRFQEKNVGDQWVVLVPHGTGVIVYGPMEAKAAQSFARFMTATVNPAEARKLYDPTVEMLAWYESEQARNNCTHAAGCPVHPLASLPHGMVGA